MNNWIKIEDKRPESETRVLVTVKEGTEMPGGYANYPQVWTAYFYEADEDFWFSRFILDGMNKHITDDVIAWMPMPKPYGEEEKQ